MKFQKQLIMLIVTVLALTIITPGLTAAANNVNAEDQITEEYVLEDYGIDLSDIDITDYNEEEFKREFDFLVQDPIFIQLENELSKPRVEITYTKNPFTGKLEAKREVLPALVIGALRVLISKVGKTAATKAWNIA